MVRESPAAEDFFLSLHGEIVDEAKRETANGVERGADKLTVMLIVTVTSWNVSVALGTLTLEETP